MIKWIFLLPLLLFSNSSYSQSEILSIKMKEGDVLHFTSNYEGCFYSTIIEFEITHLGNKLSVALLNGFDKVDTFETGFEVLKIVINYESRIRNGVNYFAAGYSASHIIEKNGIKNDLYNFPLPFPETMQELINSLNDYSNK